MKNHREYLKHIRDECEYLVERSKGLYYEKFVDDETLKRAFVRSLDWREMAGMRDVLIHGYFGIDYNTVWDVVVNYIPPLLDSMNEIIESQEP